MAPRFDELALMQTGTLFTPTVALRDQLNMVDQVIAHPLGRAIPLDVLCPVSDIDRTRQTVETESAPAPHLEGEDVRRRADLQHHRIGTTAVTRTRRNQKMVMFPRRETVNKPFIVEILLAGLRRS